MCRPKIVVYSVLYLVCGARNTGVKAHSTNLFLAFRQTKKQQKQVDPRHETSSAGMQHGIYKTALENRGQQRALTTAFRGICRLQSFNSAPSRFVSRFLHFRSKSNTKHSTTKHVYSVSRITYEYVIYLHHCPRPSSSRPQTPYEHTSRLWTLPTCNCV